MSVAIRNLEPTKSCLERPLQRRFVPWAVSVILCTASIPALAQSEPTPKSVPSGDLQKFRGEWKFIGGKVTWDSGLKPSPIRAKFEGNRVTFRYGEVPISGTFTLDPNKTPRRITMVVGRGRRASKVYAIYEFERDHVVTLKWRNGAKRYPNQISGWKEHQVYKLRKLDE